MSAHPTWPAEGAMVGRLTDPGAADPHPIRFEAESGVLVGPHRAHRDTPPGLATFASRSNAPRPIPLLEGSDP